MSEVTENVVPPAPPPEPLCAGDVAILRKRARAWRRKQIREFCGGAVIIYNGVACGWSDLSTPGSFAPGCFAVTEGEGAIYQATGGTYMAGATAWAVVVEAVAVVSPTTVATENVTPSAPGLDALWESTQMDDLDLTGKARQAIFHALGQIRSNPTVGYELGVGTLTFALLTEAYAAIVGAPVEKVRKHFHCVTAAKAGQADAQRLDWLHKRLLELPTAYTDLLGLPKVLTNLRIAIDDARAND